MEMLIQENHTSTKSESKLNMKIEKTYMDGIDYREKSGFESV